MAEESSKALKNLEQQLTCPVCLDHYTDPRTMPCLHSFCHNCLAHFPVQVQGGKHIITCPVCRQTAKQPDNGVSGFQSAFLINNLLELHQLLEKVSGFQQNNCENCHKEQAVGYCKQCCVLICQTCIDKHNGWTAFTGHEILGKKDVVSTATKLVPLKEQPTINCSNHGTPLIVYCDTCDKPICQLCTSAKAHRNHEYEPLTDAFPRHQQQITDSLKQVNEKLSVITTAVQALEIQESNFLEQVGAVRGEISTIVQQQMQFLQESERRLMKDFDHITNAYLEKISARKKEGDIFSVQLSSCKEFAEEELRIGSQQEILMMKRQIIERMTAVCLQAKEDNLRPLEEIKVGFLKSPGVVKKYYSLGSVIRFGHFETAGNKTSFELSSAPPLSSELVSCQLSSVGDPTVVTKCVIHQVAPGKFEVRYSPPTAGFYQLHVHVGETNILDTPLNVEVKSRRAGKILTGLSNPAGLAVTREGHLIVVERSRHGVTIVDPTNGRTFNSLGQRGSERLQFSNPEGATVNQDGHIIVADTYNNRLQVLTPEGAFIATVGTKGSQQLQFMYPVGVAINCDGKVFVTEYGNDRVQVLNANLSYSHCFGSKGTQPGEFYGPRGITIDCTGMIYVADLGNNRVQKFTPDGKILAVIDNKGEVGRLSKPLGVCVDGNDVLYVTEHSSNTVSVFSSRGVFLGHVGNSDGSSFKDPWYIVSDQTGQLYISNDNGVVTYCQ